MYDGFPKENLLIKKMRSIFTTILHSALSIFHLRRRRINSNLKFKIENVKCTMVFQRKTY